MIIFKQDNFLNHLLFTEKMTTVEQARREVFDCKLNGTEIADVVFRLGSKYAEGETHNLNVLDRRMFFDFESYKNTLKLLTWRNRTQQHKPDGTELVTVKKMFSKLIAKNLTDEPLQDEDYSFSFSGMGIATETSIDEEIIKYNSPSVMVSAGLYFKVEVPNAPRDFRRLLQYFADLKTSFSVEWLVDKPQAYLLNRIFEVGYDNEDCIFIRARAHNINLLKKRMLYHHQSNVWRGKVSDFGNFVHTVGNAMKVINGRPVSLRGDGVTVNGLDMMFYETGGSHDYEQLLPQGIIGRIKVTPRGREGEEVETRIYSGNEVDLDIKIVTDF